jgi:corrinoid protein of di/trimethylamine methyltransferase
MAGIVEGILQAIVEGDDDIAAAQTKKAIEDGVDTLEIFRKAIIPGIEQAGKLWQENVYFMPDVVLSAEAFKAALKVIEPYLKKIDARYTGKILQGVVAGDMHDLGKSIVIAVLMGAGFEVIDLGVDIPAEVFIEKIKELQPDILGVGCYMTTTMLGVKELMQALQEHGLRNKIKVMIGGVPTTQQFADEIGADAWGKDALDAAIKAKQLMEAVP